MSSEAKRKHGPVAFAMAHVTNTACFLISP
jgi:hypothetical protein